jgi:AraC-like DNA-binding protein
MPASTQNYFRYFPLAGAANAWGLALTAAGFTRIPPGVDYPPVRHPVDHQFDWAQGRTLDKLQLVLITTGHGHLETRSGQRSIKCDQAFLLLPGVWHRYRPDHATGWEESWIEVTGPLVKQLLRATVFSPREIIRGGGMSADLEPALEAVHTLARTARPGCNPGLAAAAYRVLAAWDQLGHSPPARAPRLQRAVIAAEQFFGEHLTEPVNVAALARRLGVAYSHFRRAFKLHTGYAPWQYMLRLRLAHARRALAAGDEATLEDVAARLGFSSGFHLSAAFKRVYGISPTGWRSQTTRT